MCYQRCLWLLVLAVLLTGCAPAPTPAPDPLARSATTRTLAMMTVRLTKELTPDAAAYFFGEPDEVTGSGLFIAIYRLSDGRRVWLGFPGNAPIVYAKVEDQAGTVTDLPLN